ncbi:hypothetical protein [Occultella glacieicola]|nr:hypothetical protein [Occultella glacieicola]
MNHDIGVFQASGPYPDRFVAAIYRAMTSADGSEAHPMVSATA